MDKGLKDVLDKLYNEMNSLKKVKNDPVSFPHRFKDEKDIEISAFISACFAFGNVKNILETLENIFKTMEYQPYYYLTSSSKGDFKSDFKGFVYRFVQGDSIAELFFSLSAFLKKKGRLIEISYSDYYSTLSSIYENLINLADNPDLIKKSNLLPDITKNSPCKRLNLFLRWMVRKDNIDFGLWSEKIKPSSLIIPLDTHILRISKRLNFTKRKTSSLKTAVEITESLKKFDSFDPVKYDFSICHTGIQGVCNSDMKKARCNLCDLQQFCYEGKIKTKRERRI